MLFIINTFQNWYTQSLPIHIKFQQLTYFCIHWKETITREFWNNLWIWSPLPYQTFTTSKYYHVNGIFGLRDVWLKRRVINRLMNSNCYGLKSSKKTLVFHAPELLSNSEVPKRWKNNYVQTCIWNLACFLFFLFFFSYWLFVGNRD